ncbi:DNA-directed RNA polymerase subunit beta' [bacterium]|jgi:DNA-directed RNA polymerase subunit beta'|nr:DNA-directed RNA polymerase subunit beta' [bacterium]MBT4251030.1 DNA-directed RNA polymerase subunit beta' [bacterium]MBT4597935.1 DNA-directed RNA polymerase subunit beta' [bacterium]MBT6753377.1 DNA-directed RNA polymerase subunit beta' [bacterium]MBT7037202.1 DNA-directed RNA polymerase subunit beta' [bacterium]
MTENITRISDFSAVQLKIASPEKILEWSHGEIMRPETINYRTQRFEKDGLFCEKIFGPSKDWECYCGKYKRIRYKGIVCDKCGVEITKSIVRRERMGHIELAVPVSHIWFLRSVPSRIGLALDMSVQELERIVYFASYIVVSVDEEGRIEALKDLESEYKLNQKSAEGETEKEEVKAIYQASKEGLKSLHKKQTLSEIDYHSVSRNFGHVFEASIGAEAIFQLLKELDLEKEVAALSEKIVNGETSDKKRLAKRLKVLAGFLNAKIKPEWMMLKVIPVIPPDLRPMVQLNGGRFATSDLNDLYRRIINRNNRLRKLIDLGAPEVIQRNEKRMLQEAVDALIDNSSRRSQAQVAASTGQRRALKSVSDMLKGKQGRFRQNLLGKRVDYSGRSVIVIGPKLKLHQCGIPKKMALELFKPFIINQLIDKEHAHNVRTAGRMVDAEREEAYEMLDNIIGNHYVLLNRAPTLHRLSIQAFQPVLIEGKAIRVHPLVCTAFNADFDGDQMAVHVPLTAEARKESAEIMLSSKNLLKPSSGDPITVPSQDIVLGAYYMTTIIPGVKGEGKSFSSMGDVIRAYQMEIIDLRAKINLYREEGKIETSAGRVLINDILPEKLRFVNKKLTKTDLKELVAGFLQNDGTDATAIFVDQLKNLGFEYVTQSGISLGMDDFQEPKDKQKTFEAADKKVEEVQAQYDMGLLTNAERKTKVIKIWNETKDKITEMVVDAIDKDGSIHAMIHSKARGSEAVVVQMTGMKGLVAGPTGETIELPIKGSLKGGYDVLEYFISTHGARKGMADTALRTATAGYLTRRLVDVGQDVVITEEDCGDTVGAYLYREDSDQIGQGFATRVEGRTTLEIVKDPKTGKKIVGKNELVDAAQAQVIEDVKVVRVKIRSLVTCQTRRGVCQKCYGKDLGRDVLVNLGQAVGTIAAQAIGEPGTQLTMRTFHIGGVAGTDITQGLPRVEEIFEARIPKAEAMIAEVDGTIEDIVENKKQKIITLRKAQTGKVKKIEEKEYAIPAVMNAKVEKGDLVTKGQVLSEGHLDLKKLFKVGGGEALHRYIICEVQEIYQTQGEGINDKHIEIVIRQMLSRVKVSDPGDTELLAGDIVEKAKFVEMNNNIREEKKQEAAGEQLVLGISKIALSTDSFLSAASFQETAKVLIDASTQGKIDYLRGLKENVILGKLIPAGTGFAKRRAEMVALENHDSIESDFVALAPTETI